MVDLIDYIKPNGSWIVNLIKSPDNKVFHSSSKWLSDEWYLKETDFKYGGNVYEFGRGAFSNINLLKEEFGYKEISQLNNFEGVIDFFSFLDPDLVVELLMKLDFQKTSIKYACIAFKPVQEVELEKNKKNLLSLMSEEFDFVKQKRTELLFINKNLK